MVKQQQQQQQEEMDDVVLVRKKLKKIDKLLLLEEENSREYNKLETKRKDYLMTLSKMEHEEKDKEKKMMTTTNNQNNAMSSSQSGSGSGISGGTSGGTGSGSGSGSSSGGPAQQIILLTKKIQKVTRLMKEYLQEDNPKHKISSKKYQSWNKKHLEYIQSYNEILNSTTKTTTTGAKEESTTTTTTTSSNSIQQQMRILMNKYGYDACHTALTQLYEEDDMVMDIMPLPSTLTTTPTTTTTKKTSGSSSSSSGAGAGGGSIVRRNNKLSSTRSNSVPSSLSSSSSLVVTPSEEQQQQPQQVFKRSSSSSITNSTDPKLIQEIINNDKYHSLDHLIVEGAIHQPIVCINHEGIIQRVNKIAIRTLGYDHENELLLQELDTIIPRGNKATTNTKTSKKTTTHRHHHHNHHPKKSNKSRTPSPPKKVGGLSSSSKKSRSLSPPKKSRSLSPPKKEVSTTTTTTNTTASSSSSTTSSTSSSLSFMEYYKLTEKSHPFSNNQQKTTYMIKKNGSQVSIQLSFQAINISKKHVTTRSSFEHDVRTMELYFICFLRIIVDSNTTTTTTTGGSSTSSTPTCSSSTGATTTTTTASKNSQGEEEKEGIPPCCSTTTTTTTTRPSSSLSPTVLSDIHQHAYLMELERNMFQKMIDAAFDACFVTNAYGTIQRVNQAGLRKFGYSTDHQLIGENIKIICGDTYAPHHDKWMANYRKTSQTTVVGTNQREVRAKRKDGSEFPALLGVRVVEQDSETGKPTMLVGFVRNLTKHKRNMHLEVEQRAAQELLLNMLPETVANRLKQDPGRIADQHKRATVLFADIVGFTAMSSHMEAVDLVVLLNDLFLRFDELVARYKLNKVKTIGDCYMVTDVPNTSESGSIYSCAAVCHFALDMIAGLAQYNLENPDHPLNVHVGIHCGPVVGGIIGSTRFLYDIWGDAVNLASRMESTGLPGQVQVSKDLVAFLLVGGVNDNDDDGPGGGGSSIIDPPPTSATDDFIFKSRGLIKIKGKGELETFIIAQRLMNGCHYYQDDSMGGSFEFSEEQRKKDITQFDSIRDLQRSFRLPTGRRVTRLSGSGLNMLSQYDSKNGSSLNLLSSTKSIGEKKK